MRYPCILFTFAMLLVSCTSDLVSPGGSGTETTTGIVGVVVDERGALQSNVEVKLFPQSYDPVHDSDTIPVDTTDSLGRYSFTKLDTGEYSIQAVHLTGRTRASIWQVQALVDTVVEAATGTLQVPGAVTISLPLSVVGALGYVYIPGTTIFTPVNGCADFVVLDSTPAGTVPHISWLSADYLSTTTLLSDVQVLAEDTVVIRDLAWNYSRRCVLNTSVSGAGVFGTVTGFPVLIRLNAGNFDFTQARPDGADLRFERKQGKFLPYETERWDAAGERAEIWVKVDTIFGNNSTQSITMYWGNPDVADSSDGAAVFDTADGFISVWHMNETPSAGVASIMDRTTYKHDATPYGDMADTSSVEGAVGRALHFDGANDYVNAGDVQVSGVYTIGVWAKIDTLDAYHRFLYKDSSYTLWYDQDSESIRMEHRDTKRWRGLLQDGGTRIPMIVDEWYYVTATYDGTTIRLYRDGEELSTSNSLLEGLINSSKPLLLGGSAPHFTKGTLDEIRIEGVVRSAEWIRLNYVNQSRNNTLVIFK